MSVKIEVYGTWGLRCHLRDRLRNVLQPLKLRRKISTAGKKPIVYLPEGVVKAINAKVGDEIGIYVEGKKIIIEKT